MPGRSHLAKIRALLGLIGMDSSYPYPNATARAIRPLVKVIFYMRNPRHCMADTAQSSYYH